MFLFLFFFVFDTGRENISLYSFKWEWVESRKQCHQEAAERFAPMKECWLRFFSNVIYLIPKSSHCNYFLFHFALYHSLRVPSELTGLRSALDYDKKCLFFCFSIIA